MSKKTGMKTNRPAFNELLKLIGSGDKLIVTKLDRIARSAIHGFELIQNLLKQGVTVHVLNMGLMDNTPTGISRSTLLREKRKAQFQL